MALVHIRNGSIFAAAPRSRAAVILPARLVVMRSQASSESSPPPGLGSMLDSRAPHESVCVDDFPGQCFDDVITAATLLVKHCDQPAVCRHPGAPQTPDQQFELAMRVYDQVAHTGTPASQWEDYDWSLDMAARSVANREGSEGAKSESEEARSPSPDANSIRLRDGLPSEYLATALGWESVTGNK